MKKFFITLSIVITAITANAQKLVPQIKTGTILNYTAHARAMGQTVPAFLTITQFEAPLRMKWAIGPLGSGTFEISAKAIQSGTKMALREPGYEEITKLKDNETIAFISKDTFTSLTTNKAFELNGQKFIVVTDAAPAFTLGDKEVDTFYATTANGKTKIWILNNPDFPLVCKIEGAPQGIDLSLNSVQ
ncbi:hypothetical protein [Mucilaginibacter terrae]|uniref:Uncharacterized protein n=1 Tax=Mucilaginibacter terrae TaxID=1955052 RepID=A0ABU3GT82_9SPHI|nr:hypothetical protein [Mucilaginibacter terrae]MDT3402994.1 hypothetical protein [Mucilaginibacter terrae]